MSMLRTLKSPALRRASASSVSSRRARTVTTLVTLIFGYTEAWRPSGRMELDWSMEVTFSCASPS
jgi:hypothetical protein